MRYLILIYSNPEARKVWESFPAEDRRVGLEAYEQLNADLVESGELVVTHALAEPARGRGIGPRAAALASDGPFAEAKEHLGGFYVVDVESEARAVEIAERVPEAPLGLVEIRPVMELSGFLE